MANFNFVKWNNRWRFEGKRFSDILAEGSITALRKDTNNAVRYDRRKFNAMNYDEQKDYSEKVNRRKTEYGFSINNQESWYEIPKAVFEMVLAKYPGMIIKSSNFFHEL